MTRVQEVNLQDILSIAQTNSTRRASRLLSNHENDRKYLGKLLRDHRNDPVDDEETYSRDDIDNLIGMYGLLEIACVARFVPESLPVRLRTSAAKQLSIPEVRRFYTEIYPQLLPQSFLRRVNAEPAPSEPDGPDLAGQFMRFMAASREFEGDADIETLLTLLDDYEIDGLGWSDVAEIVQSPARFVSVLSKRRVGGDLVVAGVFGYWKFVGFCNDLHDLLRALGERPLLQSAVWHYYAYWFDLLKDKVGLALKRSLASIEAMLSSQADAHSQLALSSIGAQRKILEDLTSNRYSETLESSFRRTSRILER